MIALFAAAMPVALTAATSERVVQDRHSGLAINGVDPVGYFTEAAVVAGRADIEASALGAVWRFRNAGNLAMFMARPDVYGPQFGGYDPIDIARGVPRPGSPQIWLIDAQRLYLFADDSNRDAFAANVAHSVRDATARWPALLTTLAE